jgi:hypothetical protein
MQPGEVALLGLTAVTTAAVAAAWVWVDRRGMATGLEQYGADGWWRVVILGAFAAAVVWGVGRVGIGVYGWGRS